jgi:hypothetical protein
MAPFFALMKSVTSSEEEEAERIFEALLETERLADEPEFETYYFDPVQAFKLLSDSDETVGIDVLDLDDLSEEEQEDTKIQMVARIIEHLLTPDVRKEILNRLDQLRRRLRQTAMPQEIALVAALQSFLTDNPKDPIWAVIGLNRALFNRSLKLTMDFLDERDEMDEEFDEPADEAPEGSAVEAGQEGNILAFADRLQESALVKNLTRIVGKVPGLRKQFEAQVEDMRADGIRALYHQELRLELFNEAEHQEGSAIVQAVLDEVEVNQADDEAVGDEAGETAAESDEEAVRWLINDVDQYLDSILTPARLEQMRAHIKTLLERPTYPPKWNAFVLLLSKELAAEEAAQTSKDFFIKAFVGEVQTFMNQEPEDEPTEADSA